MIINEDFEGAGTPSGWFRGGSADFDYSASPLSGSQSLYLADATGDFAQTPLFNQSEIWGYFLVRFPVLPASFLTFFNLQDSSFNNILRMTLNSTGTITASDSGVGIFNTSVSALSANTIYNFWYHYKKGTGSNCVVDVMFSTVNTRPAVGANNWAGGTTGVSTTNTDHVQVLAGGSIDLEIDNFELDSVDDWGGGGAIVDNLEWLHKEHIFVEKPGIGIFDQLKRIGESFKRKDGIFVPVN